MSYSDLVTQAESGGNPNATNPNSSASGLGQFTSGTWLDTIKANRPDLAQGRSDDELLAMRSDPQLSREMTDAYGNANAAILQKNGLPVTDGTKYLAHFSGPGGAVKILQADPNAPVESILSKEAIAANPFLKGMTAQGLQAWAAKKVGVQAPQPGNASGTQVRGPQGILEQIGDWAADQNLPTALTRQNLEMNPMGVNALGRAALGIGGSPNSRVEEGHRIIQERTVNPPAGPPMQILPQLSQAQQPIFAQTPQQQTAQPVAPPDIPQIQPAQIQYARPRPIDLSALRAVFPSPIFAKG